MTTFYVRKGAFQAALVVKNLPASVGDAEVGLIPRSGRSPGVGNGNTLQCSCLGNPRGRGALSLQSTGLKKNQTRLSEHT